MRFSIAKSFCRLLIALVAILPFHDLQAAMISTDAASMAQSAAANRNIVARYLVREDVTRQLQAQGIDARAAAKRVDALTDEEAAALAGDIQSAPAGGIFGGTVWPVLLVVAIGVFIYFLVHRR